MRLLILVFMVFSCGIAFGEDDAPPSPFAKESDSTGPQRPGWLLMSDGTLLAGSIRTTLAKPITVYDREEKKYHRLPWSSVATITVALDSEELQPDWRWKENGSDVKVYTGLFYYWHKYCTTVTLKSGEAVSGDVSAPIYVMPEGAEERQRFILHKRNKGEKMEKADAVPPAYVQKIVLTDVEGAEEPPQPKDEPDDDTADTAAEAESE